jgi:hypothetical protein
LGQLPVDKRNRIIALYLDDAQRAQWRNATGQKVRGSIHGLHYDSTYLFF